MSKSTLNYLYHIIDECNYIISVITKNTPKNDFINNETLKRAIVRSLEVIGEASKKIPDSFKDKWTEIPWRSMSGMRDKLIHDYVGVNYVIVWDVVKNIIPVLKEQIEKIIKEEEENIP